MGRRRQSSMADKPNKPGSAAAMVAGSDAGAAVVLANAPRGKPPNSTVANRPADQRATPHHALAKVRHWRPIPGPPDLRAGRPGLGAAPAQSAVRQSFGGRVRGRVARYHLAGLQTACRRRIRKARPQRSRDGWRRPGRRRRPDADQDGRQDTRSARAVEGIQGWRRHGGRTVRREGTRMEHFVALSLPWASSPKRPRPIPLTATSSGWIGRR